MRLSCGSVPAHSYGSSRGDQIRKENDNKAKGRGDDDKVKNFLAGGTSNNIMPRSNAHFHSVTAIVFADLFGFTK